MRGRKTLVKRIRFIPTMRGVKGRETHSFLLPEGITDRAGGKGRGAKNLPLGLSEKRC